MDDITEDYKTSLADLTQNSKPLINMLTMLAEDKETHADKIVEVIETHLQQVESTKKLPTLYLIDSIIKNLPKSTYPGLFSHNIVSIFCNMFEQVDEKTRQCMFKVRQTWNQHFTGRKMYALDMRVNNIDHAWPLSTPTSNISPIIHLNPKFLQQQREESLPLPDLPPIEDDEAEMSRLLLPKQAELLKLQQKRLELEMKETETRLAQQKKTSEDLFVGVEPETASQPGGEATALNTQLTASQTVPRDPRLRDNRDPRMASRDPRVCRDPRMRNKHKDKKRSDPRKSARSKESKEREIIESKASSSRNSRTRTRSSNNDSKSGSESKEGMKSKNKEDHDNRKSQIEEEKDRGKTQNVDNQRGKGKRTPVDHDSRKRNGAGDDRDKGKNWSDSRNRRSKSPRLSHERSRSPVKDSGRGSKNPPRKNKAKNELKNNNKKQMEEQPKLEHRKPISSLPRIPKRTGTDVDERVTEKDHDESRLSSSNKRDLDERHDYKEHEPVRTTKKPRISQEKDVPTIEPVTVHTKMNEDISNLFGNEDQDNRHSDAVSPRGGGWARYKADHPKDFDNRRSSLEDIDHRIERQPRDTDYRPTPYYRPPVKSPGYIEGGRSGPQPSDPDVPSELRLENRENILRTMEMRRKSGEISHDDMQTVLRSLSEFDSIQEQRRHQPLRQDPPHLEPEISSQRDDRYRINRPPNEPMMDYHSRRNDPSEPPMEFQSPIKEPRNLPHDADLRSDDRPPVFDDLHREDGLPRGTPLDRNRDFDRRNHTRAAKRPKEDVHTYKESDRPSHRGTDRPKDDRFLLRGQDRPPHVRGRDFDEPGRPRIRPEQDTVQNRVPMMNYDIDHRKPPHLERGPPLTDRRPPEIEAVRSPADKPVDERPSLLGPGPANLREKEVPEKKSESLLSKTEPISKLSEKRDAVVKPIAKKIENSALSVGAMLESLRSEHTPENSQDVPDKISKVDVKPKKEETPITKNPPKPAVEDAPVPKLVPKPVYDHNKDDRGIMPGGGRMLDGPLSIFPEGTEEIVMNDQPFPIKLGGPKCMIVYKEALSRYDETGLADMEEKLISSFSNGDSWKEGKKKTSFNYLLLDPRVTKNLPNRMHSLGEEESFEVFVKAIFYVGKGQRSRPNHHLYEALSQIETLKPTVSDNVKHIINIWSENVGVISLHCFQNVIPVEAYTRETCMIDAISVCENQLTNQMKGKYYGISDTWSRKEKRNMGFYFLKKALKIFKEEGERPLLPVDLKDNLKESNSSSQENEAKSLISNEDHYMPKRGVRVPKCDFIMQSEDQLVPTGYVRLAEGHQIYVPVAWLNELQGSFRGKTKSCALKLMISGFFEPKDVTGKTGVQLSDTPRGKAIKAYALTNFQMDSRTVVVAFNSKIGTMIRAIKMKRAANADIDSN